jgi:hypothetical protein
MLALSTIFEGGWARGTGKSEVEGVEIFPATCQFLSSSFRKMDEIAVVPTPVSFGTPANLQAKRAPSDGGGWN